MKLLLAGASGFLGRHVLLSAPKGWEITALFHTRVEFPAWLADQGVTGVTPVRCDLRSAESSAAALARVPPFDATLFLAGNPNIASSYNDPLGDVAATLGGLINLIQHSCTRRFVLLSSGTVYLGAKGAVSPAIPVAPMVPYGITKLASERYLQFFQQSSNRIEEALVVRFFGAYGPLEPSWKIFGRLIRAFAVEGRRSYCLRGDGQNLIDAMYCTDAAGGLWSAVTGTGSVGCVDFCAGAPRTLTQLVEDVGSILGVGAIVIEYEGDAAERIDFRASPEGFAVRFGFRPQITLAEGIERYRASIVGGDDRKH